MNIIRELRKKAGIQQKELALEIGVSIPTVSEWENGKKDPSGDRLKRLSEYFGVDELVILGRGGAFVPMIRNALPMLGTVPCGKPITPDLNAESIDLPQGVTADFALKCKGDSMEPTFMDGDFVLIRAQPDVENGQIAAVNIAGETTLKHVYHHADGLLLVADNPKYAPIFAPFSDDEPIIIHGLAVGYLRVFD